MQKPVLVVGAGPVGLTMAAELARYRMPVRIVDKASARTDKSKALAIWARTLELLDRAGCADAFAAAGLKVEAVGIHAGSEVVTRVTFEDVASPFNYMLMLPQSETERLLEAHLASLGGKVDRDTELVDFAETGDGVSCTLRRPDGQTETLAARWLIGCDGAHSTIRHKLGMAFEGDTMATNFVIADVHIAGSSLPRDELAIFWHRDGVVLFFPISPTRFRIIADTGDDARHDPTLEEVQTIVDRRGPGQLALSDPIWLSGFSVNERKVKDYRAGRVFLAGDAAHVHSPAGGQGMNTGMQDAFNLAWKMALVDEGGAGPSLLDSYSPERSAVATRILSDSGRMTRIAMIRNEFAQTIRGFVAHHLLGISAVNHTMANRLSEITIGYPDSPLNAGAGSGLGPRPGERYSGDRPFGAGDAPHFALVARDDAQARVRIGRHPGLLESDPRPPNDDGLWLVRPDGYVAAAARAGDWQVIDLALSRLRTDARSGAAVSP